MSDGKGNKSTKKGGNFIILCDECIGKLVLRMCKYVLWTHRLVKKGHSGTGQGLCLKCTYRLNEYIGILHRSENMLSICIVRRYDLVQGWGKFLDKGVVSLNRSTGLEGKSTSIRNGSTSLLQGKFRKKRECRIRLP